MKNFTHWSAISEAGTTLGMRILLAAYALFGRWGFRLFLFPVILYYYLMKHDARAASREYLERVKPYVIESSQSLTPFRHFVMFGETLLDKFLAWMGKIALDDVAFESDGFFEKVSDAGQGGIIIVSHLGNMEVCNAIAHQQSGLKLNLLVYTKHAKKFNALMQKVNQSSQIEMIQVTEMTPAFAMSMSEKIAAGEHLAIAGDRTPVTGEQRTSNVAFLGRQAPMPQGAFILASLLKCPVMLMFCLKQEKRYTIYLERFSDKLEFPRQQRAELLQKYVQEYATRLQFFCIKAPLQWFNFYAFWLDSKKENK